MGVLGAPVLNKVGFLLILFSLGFFGKRENVEAPRIQRAVVIENQAVIYAQPDFDAKQIMKLPQNKIIAISTQIYRPKNLFGSFYRIFINKPRKIRGYISEIDVLPQYKKSERGYVLNKEYQKKEKALKQIQSELLRSEKKAAPKLQKLEVSKSSKEKSQEEKTLEQPSDDSSATSSSAAEVSQKTSEKNEKSEEKKADSEELKKSDKKLEDSSQKELEKKEHLKEAE